MADVARGFAPLQPGDDAELDHAIPTGAAQRVQQVEIEMIGAQAPALIFKDAVKVGGRFDHAHQHLGGELDLVALAGPLQVGAHKALALAAMVGIAVVQVVDALSQRQIEHLR